MINYYIDKFKTSFVEPIEQNYFIPVVKKINKITVRNTFMIHYFFKNWARGGRLKMATLI